MLVVLKILARKNCLFLTPIWSFWRELQFRQWRFLNYNRHEIEHFLPMPVFQSLPIGWTDRFICPVYAIDLCLMYNRNRSEWKIGAISFLCQNSSSLNSEFRLKEVFQLGGHWDTDNIRLYKCLLQDDLYSILYQTMIPIEIKLEYHSLDGGDGCIKVWGSASR